MRRRELMLLGGAMTVARAPALYPEREFVDSGGLVTYGPSVRNNFRRGQPLNFEFAVNLKSAEALGFTIAPSILDRASEVIE